MYILHLSDLHFGTTEHAENSYTQLSADLHNQLNIDHLDVLVLSGDIANKSTPQEYEAAQLFLKNFCSDFRLTPSQIVMVPGNHDLNWGLSEHAYQVYRRKDYQGPRDEGRYIEEGERYIEVRDEEKYQLRFQYFSEFYKTITGKTYPLEYGQQATIHPWNNLLFVGFNSAWQLDHYYKTRASIHPNAITNALIEIRKNPIYKNLLKIAVWHHPLNSPFEDKIKDMGFMEQLAKSGFRFVLHGHIHTAETNLYNYDITTAGRKLNVIGAGTFGVPMREWVPGYPLQYNLLKIEKNQLRVYTRCREELDAAWKPDTRWQQDAEQSPLDYYTIQL